MTRVLVVGEALVDVVHDAAGESARPGGSPFTIAVALARLGVDTTLAAQVADDAYGQLLRSTLAEAGARWHDLAPTPERTSSAVATIGSDGSARYAFDVTWDPERFPDPSGCRAVHVGSIATVLEPGAERLVAWLAEVRDAGAPISFDPNVRLAVLDDVPLVRRRFTQIAALASVVKLSDEDAAVLFDDASADDVVTRLAAGGALAVVTLGGDGAVLARDGHHVRVPGVPVRVVDTIGAGDTFMAALIALSLDRVAHGDPWTASELADLGVVAAQAAAITCSRRGANPPTRAELYAALGPGR